MSRDAGGRIAIVTVHGTGDTAPEPDGPADGDHWFLKNSKFVRALKEKLAAQGVQADVIPHLWTGANSAMAREAASRKLAGRIKALSGKYGGEVHIVGHSHGGNVANDAACMLGWSGKQKRHRIASVTTVGTPFFRTRITAGERFGAWLFVLVVALSAILYIPAATIGRQYASSWINEEFIKFVSMPAQRVEEANACAFDAGVTASAMRRGAVTPPAPDPSDLFQDALRPWSPEEVQCVTNRARSAEEGLDRFFTGLGVATAVALLFMVPLSFRGVGRIRRAGRRKRQDRTIRAIWHPNDEAITFLSALDRIPIAPFPRGSFWAGSRTTAIQIGVRTVLYTDIVGLLLLGVAPELAIVLLAAGTAGAPLLFMAGYVANRLFAALVLELSLRGWLNGVIGNALKAIAFGRDGDNRVGDVGNMSHYYETELVTLNGDVAQRMLASSTEASARLFERYRKGVFSADDGPANAISEMAKDALTWDSLIHTIYFEQPEIVDHIAGHIVRSRAGAPATA